MTLHKEFRIEGFHHVLLAIPEGGEEQCREFWGQMLGLTELAKPETLIGRGGCWFRGDGIEIHLGVEADFSPTRKAHPAILVTDLVALANRFEANDVALTWDDAFLGFDRFYANDPFGNRIEFLQPRN